MASKTRKRKAASMVTDVVPQETSPVVTEQPKKEEASAEFSFSEIQQIINDCFTKHNRNAVVKRLVGDCMVIFDVNGKEVRILRNNNRTKITEIKNGAEVLVYLEVMTKFNIEESLAAAKAALVLHGI